METKKQIYQEKMQAHMDQMNAKIERLIAEFDEANPDTRQKVQDQIDDLTDQQNQAEAKFNEFKNAEERNWKKMRSDVEEALDNLQESLEQTAQEFEKIS
jgi:D-ribose pyranose/furanose isomerase RbsD